MQLNVIQKIAFDQMGNKSSHPWKEQGNKYHHGQRVAALIRQLRPYVLPDDDSQDDIMTIAAWFHDIMNGDAAHEVKGAQRTRELLHDHLSADQLEAVCAIITIHDDRHCPREQLSDYAKLHQDADLLDHFGSFDIWSRFLFGLHQDQTLPEVAISFDDLPLLDRQYRNELNFPLSRCVFDEKLRFEKDFAARFTVEGNGGVWRFDELAATQSRKKK